MAKTLALFFKELSAAKTQNTQVTARPPKVSNEGVNRLSLKQLKCKHGQGTQARAQKLSWDC